MSPCISLWYVHKDIPHLDRYYPLQALNEESQAAGCSSHGHFDVSLLMWASLQRLWLQQGHLTVSMGTHIQVAQLNPATKQLALGRHHIKDLYIPVAHTFAPHLGWQQVPNVQG